MIRKAPRLLIVLLAALVLARLGIVFVVHSPIHTALAWAALLGALSIAALYGKRVAADALAWLCLALGVDIVIQLLRTDLPLVHLVAASLWASLLFGVGLYLLLSKAVKGFCLSGNG